MKEQQNKYIPDVKINRPNIVYDYVIVDSKLVAYNSFHRKQHATHMFKTIADALKFNKINFKKVLYASDFNKSEYRLNMQHDYKGQRKEIQSRDNDKHKKEREAFLKDYMNLSKIFNDVGYSLQDLNSTLEADDLSNIIRTLKPKANILLFSLDEDWYYRIENTGTDKGNTHLLKYSKNELYTHEEQVEELYGLPFDILPHYSALKGQKKDSIYGLVNIAKARFKKHFLPYPVDEWEDIANKLIEEKKYNLHIHPKAKFQDVKAQYHHNLLMMNPIPIHKVKPNELVIIKKALDSKPTDLTYEDFIRKCISIFNVFPTLQLEDYKLLKYGNVK